MRALALAALLFLGACVVRAEAPVPAPLWGCMAAGAQTSPDSIFLVFFHHPCDAQADSIMGWRIPSRLRECDLFFVADAVSGKLQTNWLNCRVLRRGDP